LFFFIFFKLFTIYILRVFQSAPVKEHTLSLNYNFPTLSLMFPLVLLSVSGILHSLFQCMLSLS